MAEIATAPADQPDRVSTSVGGKHHFLLRRLHSLTGFIPVGVFLIFHLFTNAQMLLADLTGDPHYFQGEVDFIHGLPALIILEISLWGAIFFHAILGLVYTFKGSGMNALPYESNWRYNAQRITGVIGLLFIIYHVGSLRWGWAFLGPAFYANMEDGDMLALMGVDVYPLAHASTAVHLQYAWWTVALYVIGVFSLVFHFANGMWTFAITWGLTISRAAQRRWGQACAALGVVLVFFSAAAIGSAMTYDIDEASRVIQIYEKKLDGGELTPEDRAYLAELAEARTDASIGSHNH